MSDAHDGRARTADHARCVSAEFLSTASDFTGRIASYLHSLECFRTECMPVKYINRRASALGMNRPTAQARRLRKSRPSELC